jgi:membrane protein implicated in regulation of membrane protease activity|tara:strand:- start:136 stop:621 length:486 start_codon:yes stop_codon:yes gene_type:complete
VNQWLVTILDMIGVTVAFLAMAILFLMLKSMVRNKQKRRTKKMSSKSEAREGVTFNDIFMFMIAVPLVLLWVGFAGFVIHTGLNNSAVLENIEAYTTLIAILGGPALLIIKDALDVWKQEQAEKTAFYKVKAQSVIDYNASVLQQAQDIETNEQVHEHKKK